jgi:UDPglucose 6-dehydrogenase
VLGAAFKPDSDDVRDSPALDVAAALQQAGASVRLFDPQAMANAAHLHPSITYASSIDEALADADVTAVLTEWAEFAGLDPAHAGRLVAQRRVLDARDCLPRQEWAAAGWRVHTLGRGEVGSG